MLWQVIPASVQLDGEILWLKVMQEKGPQTAFNIIGTDVPEALLFNGDALISSLSQTPPHHQLHILLRQYRTALFEQLCTEHTYYLFKTEKAIIAQYAKSVAEITGPISLIELGAGNAEKPLFWSTPMWRLMAKPLTLHRHQLLDLNERG